MTLSPTKRSRAHNILPADYGILDAATARRVPLTKRRQVFPYVFGTGGAGHVRLNFATSQAILVEAVSRMGRALANFLAERTRLAHTGSSSSVPRPRLRKPSAGFLMPSKNGSELDSNLSFNHSRPNELRSDTITGVTSDVARSM
jgi:hypothetical protein